MSLEAIERVTQEEESARARKAEAEIKARQLIADAERQGAAMLQAARAAGAEEAKELLRLAEASAESRTAQIADEAQQSAEELRKTAEKYLDEAADFIVERVVRH